MKYTKNGVWVARGNSSGGEPGETDKEKEEEQTDQPKTYAEIDDSVEAQQKASSEDGPSADLIPETSSSKTPFDQPAPAPVHAKGEKRLAICAVVFAFLLPPLGFALAIKALALQDDYDQRKGTYALTASLLMAVAIVFAVIGWCAYAAILH